MPTSMEKLGNGMPGVTPWQQALNDAENARNFANAYSGYASGAPVTHDGGTAGGEGGSNDYGTVDFSQMKAPDITGPAAYNLLGLTNGQTYDTQADAAATLARVRQFDPNATITQGSYLNSDSGTSNPNWVLNFDQSKLPKPQHQGAVSVGGYGRDDLYNQDAIAYDPNYGAVTDPRNVHYHDSSWIDYGPMVIGALGMGAPLLFGAAGLGMGTAGAAQAAIGAANGGLAATEGGMAGLSGLSTPLASAIGKGLPSEAQSIANHNFNPFQVAGMGLNYIPGVTPFMASMGRMGLNYIGRKGG